MLELRYNMPASAASRYALGAGGVGAARPAPAARHGGSNPHGGLWGPPLGSDRPWLVFFLAREGVEPDAVFLTLRFLNGAP